MFQKYIYDEATKYQLIVSFFYKNVLRTDSNLFFQARTLGGNMCQTLRLVGSCGKPVNLSIICIKATNSLINLTRDFS